MKKYLAPFALTSLICILQIKADSSVREICPVELRELISDSSSSCEEVYPLARPFLNRQSDERLRKSNEFIGDLLINSIKNDLASIGSYDQIYSSLGVDLGSVESCSLERIASNLPCSGSEQANLEALTGHFPGGAISDIGGLVNMISNDYRNRVQMDQSMDSGSCMNSAWDGNIALQSIFLKDGDLTTLINFAKGQSEDLSIEERLQYNVLNDEFRKNFPAFYERLISIGSDSISGNTLRDQLTNFLDNSENKSLYQQSIGEICSSMISRIGSIVCSPLDNGNIQNSDFNNSALDYDAGVFSSGFDDFAVELSGSDPEEAFGNYILNCTPSCVDCGNRVSVDQLISENFDGDIRLVINETHEAEQLISERSRNEDFCPLLNCENALEVFRGEACVARESWRSPTEIRALLNCPEDEMCGEDSFQSFTEVLEVQNQSIRSAEDNNSTSLRVSGMSSFSRSFLGVEDSGSEQVSRENLTGETPPVVTSTRILPDSDFAEARTRIEEADSRVSASDRRGTVEVTEVNSNGDMNSTSFNGRASRQAINRGRRPTSKDFYQDDSDDSGLGGVLDSLIDVVKGRSDVNRLRGDLIDGSLQDIARNNQEMLSRLSDTDSRIGQAYEQGVRSGRSSGGTERTYRDYNGSGIATNNNRANPLQVELPGQGQVVEGALESEADGDSVSGNRGNSSQGGGGVAGVTASAGGSTGSGVTSGGTGAQAQPEVIAESEEGELPQYEINQQTLRILDPTLLRSNLRRRGIKPDEPFLMLISAERGQSVRLPVKPLTYLGQIIFVPVIMGENAGIVGLVEQSPLFAGYRDYLGRR